MIDKGSVSYMSIVLQMLPSAKNNQTILEILDSIDRKHNILGYSHNPYSHYYGIYSESSTFTRLIGFSKFEEPDETSAELDTLAIHADYQKRGFGSQLLTSSIQQLQIRFPHVQKIIIPNGERAIGFYTKNGFKKVEEGKERFLVKQLEQNRVSNFLRFLTEKRD